MVQKPSYTNTRWPWHEWVGSRTRWYLFQCIQVDTTKFINDLQCFFRLSQIVKFANDICQLELILDKKVQHTIQSKPEWFAMIYLICYLFVCFTTSLIRIICSLFFGRLKLVLADLHHIWSDYWVDCLKWNASLSNGSYKCKCIWWLGVGLWKPDALLHPSVESVNKGKPGKRSH